jgi:hypothetical protein
MFTTGSDTMLLQLATAMRITVPNLVNVITIAFQCAFSEIQWRKVRITVRKQGVSHNEELVEFGIASRDKIRLPSILAFKLRHPDIHLGSTNLHPDEFPVEVKIITECLARLKGGILYPTLGKRCHK